MRICCISGNCESGTILSETCDLGDESCWPKLKTVTFRIPFNTVPVVTIGITKFDFTSGLNIRAKAEVTEVTTREFTVRLSQWHDTKLWVLNVGWMACHP